MHTDAALMAEYVAFNMTLTISFYNLGYELFNKNAFSLCLSPTSGASHAKLIAQKGKGMPRMSVSLAKLSAVVASQAMASLSMELYKEYKNVHKSLVKGNLFFKILIRVPFLFQAS